MSAPYFVNPFGLPGPGSPGWTPGRIGHDLCNHPGTPTLNLPGIDPPHGQSLKPPEPWPSPWDWRRDAGPRIGNLKIFER
jgi:hypothetical protein